MEYSLARYTSINSPSDMEYSKFRYIFEALKEDIENEGKSKKRVQGPILGRYR